MHRTLRLSMSDGPGTLNALEVFLLCQQLRLDLAGAGRVPVRAFPAYHYSQGWVLGKAVGIIGVVVSSEAAVD